MEHTEIRRKLSEYLDNEVGATERREIEVHLDGCARCREALAELKQVVAAIREIPPVEPSPWLTTRIMARIREEAVPRPGLLRRIFHPFHIRIPLEAAILVCLCVTGYYLATRTAPELAKEPSTSRQVDILRETMDQQKHMNNFPPRDKTLPLPTAVPSAAPPARNGEVTAPTAPSREESGSAPRLPVTQPSAGPVAPAPTADTVKAEKSLPAPPQLLQSAPAAARKESHITTAESVRTARDAVHPAPSPVRITISVDDPVLAEREIEGTVSRLGGAVVQKESTQTGRSVAVRVASDRLPDLWSRVERLGRVTERPARPMGLSGEVTVTILLDASH